MRKRNARAISVITGLFFVFLSQLVLQPSMAATAATPLPEKPSMLATVKARGALRCGASVALAGFGAVDEKGAWSGFDIDFCRAIAAAIFGDASKVEFVALTARERFQALEKGEVDVLSRNTTWTLSRETSHDLLFAGVTYYDGQGFLVRHDLGVASGLESIQRCDLRAARHDDRAEPGRLLSAARLALPAEDLSDRGRSRGRLSKRRVRRLHNGRFRSLRDAREPATSRRQHHPCPKSSRRSHSVRRCARATTNGSRSCDGR